MNAQRFLASTAVVAGVVLATVVLLRTPQTPLRVGSPDPVELPPLSAQPSENVGAADLARTATTSAGVVPAKPVKPVLAAATRVHTVLFEDAAQPAQMLRVPAASPLAKVNDVIITLKDLVPGESAEKLMSSEMYHSLLDQAIERELTFQAARAKGIELSEGSYAQAIQKSCSLLTDAINLGQDGLERAKNNIDKKLDQVRQVIHKKTAPRPTGARSRGAPSGAAVNKSAARKSRSRKPKNKTA